MTKEQTIQEARDYISDSRLGQALSVLHDYLRKEENSSRSLINRVVQFQARYADLVRKKQADTLPEEQIRKTHNQLVIDLLEFVDQWENSSAMGLAKSSIKWLLPLSFVVILGIGWGVYTVMNKDASIRISTSGIPCPQFLASSKFNTIILPFRQYGEKNLPVHEVIQQRLEKVSAKFDVAIGNKVLQADEDLVQTKLSENEEKEILCRDCEANLVVWGSAEGNKEDNMITSYYRYVPTEGETKENGFFELSQFIPDFGSQVTQIQTLTAIAKDGVTTKHIENVIHLALGIIYIRLGRDSAALNVLDEVVAKSEADSTLDILKGMYVAEANLQMGKEEDALLAYNNVLDVHPQYPLARLNRGALRLKYGKYDEARKDFEYFLDNKENNVPANIFLGLTLEKQDRIQEARERFEIVLSVLESENTNPREKESSANNPTKEGSVINRIKEKIAELNMKEST